MCHSHCRGWGGTLGVVFSLGKLEALAILLQKLKSEGRRVLILSQMVLMLDILETFLNFHYLTYIRIDENANSEQRQVRKELGTRQQLRKLGAPTTLLSRARLNV